MDTHVYKIGVEKVVEVVKNVVIVKNVTKGPVSFSGVSEGDRSAVLGHGQLRGVLYAVLYTCVCIHVYKADVENIAVVVTNVTKGQ